MAHEKKIIIQNATNAIHQKQIINRQVFTDRETPRNIFWDRYKKFITQKILAQFQFLNTMEWAVLVKRHS